MKYTEKEKEELKAKKKNPMHELTYQPGGRTLQLKFYEGGTQVQPRVKYPSKYIKRVLEDESQTLKEVYDITDRNNTKLIWSAEEAGRQKKLPF